jgi:hypothetical protein
MPAKYAGIVASQAFSSRSMRKFSITVFASNLRHMSSMSESLADVVHAGKAEAFERMMDGLALGVEDAGLQGDEDARFHG